MAKFLIGSVTRVFYILMGGMIAMLILSSSVGKPKIPELKINGGGSDAPLILETDRPYMLSLMLIHADELQPSEHPVVGSRVFPIAAELFGIFDEEHQPASSVTLNLEAAMRMDVEIHDELGSGETAVNLVPVFSIRLMNSDGSLESCEPDDDDQEGTTPEWEQDDGIVI